MIGVVKSAGRVTAPSVFEMTLWESELTKVVWLNTSVEEDTVEESGINVNVCPLDVIVVGAVMPVAIVNVAPEVLTTVSPFELVDGGV